MGSMIDTETISLLQSIFYPTETSRRHPITTHCTVDWDVATIIEALKELYPLHAEHRHLDLGSRWQRVIERSNSRIRIQSDNMAQVQRDIIQENNSGATTIGPIPHSMNERVLKSLSQSSTMLFGSGPDQSMGEAGDEESTHKWLDLHSVVR